MRVRVPPPAQSNRTLADGNGLSLEQGYSDADQRSDCEGTDNTHQVRMPTEPTPAGREFPVELMLRDWERKSVMVHGGDRRFKLAKVRHRPVCAVDLEQDAVSPIVNHHLVYGCDGQCGCHRSKCDSGYLAPPGGSPAQQSHLPYFLVAPSNTRELDVEEHGEVDRYDENQDKTHESGLVGSADEPNDAPRSDSHEWQRGRSSVLKIRAERRADNVRGAFWRFGLKHGGRSYCYDGVPSGFLSPPAEAVHSDVCEFAANC
jgi:hypothetical protein